ncbi:kinetochore Sim4 complex subunit Fta4 [Apodospora peruviana]|uniref:Kinetochore Sim4 complex subunit Fta4 n=1 Tax=Apodospora peruviana TaxID=516989 RepID=A0AAE0MAV8_9PEZI|nr:kinetochore Sim4 complex subunit Fta4 [Apodospora peruviana]
MASAPPAVITLKQDFLSAQTRVLSQPLNPSRTWRQTQTTNNSDSYSGYLPEKAVDDALFRLNHRLAQHARRVYAPQATRHVAEQIDQLYWAAAAALPGDNDGGDEETAVGEESLSVGADLADTKIIASLPSTWDANDETVGDEEEAKRRYEELVASLQGLAARKQDISGRVVRLRRMQALLEPFDNTATAATNQDEGGGETGKSVQDNLITRNGEVEKELQRMRMLLARVGGRVSQLPSRSTERGDGDTDEVMLDYDTSLVDDFERRKVDQLLERF